MTDYRDDIEFYGSRVDAGDISRETAALQLVECSYHRLDVREARQAIDTWQGYRARMEAGQARRNQRQPIRQRALRLIRRTSRTAPNPTQI